MTTVASILLSDIVPLRTRGTWQGILNIVFAIGAATGGPLGGWLADTVGWRWSFIGQTPITIIAFLTVEFFLHLPPVPVKPYVAETDSPEDTSLRARLQRVDFAGASILIIAIFAFLLSLDLGTNSQAYHPTSPLILSLFLGSIFLFIGFYHIEASYSAEPFCPPALVKRREIFSSCIANFFSLGGFMAAMFHFPLFYQAVLGTDAATAGRALTPTIFGIMVGSLCGGIYMQKTGKYYWLTFWAYFLCFAGLSLSLVCFILSGTNLSGIKLLILLELGMIILNIGSGTGVTSTLIALISNVTSAEQAVVTALSYLFRSLGSVLGLSMSAVLLQTGLKRRLLRQLGDGSEVDDIVSRVTRDLDYIGELKPDVAAIVRGCYQGGLVDAMSFAVVLGLLSWVSSWWIKEVRVKR